MGKAPAQAIGSQKRRSNAFLYFMIAVPVALMIIPTVVVLSVALLPTGVAFLIERGKGYYAGITVGAFNMAGAAPYLTDLWFGDHTVDGALAIITNLWFHLLIYVASLFGWALYATMPSIIGSFMTMTAGRRVEGMRAQQKELVAKWGPDVESVYEPEGKEKAQTAANTGPALR
ncbi:MAG: hypothetical protein SFV21_18660 [Rhodospirillaceae bacterium]|nr:hypothetical protein [Rhodospirillaceae bacterium]